MLAKLDELKARLDVSLDDGTQDDDLSLALGAASQKILDLCGYVETDTAGVQQIYRGLRLDREARLDQRPVKLDANGNPVSFVVEGRGLGMSTFSTLAFDLIDPVEGTFLILGAAEWWPPIIPQQPAFRRWRNIRWPVVRVTYEVEGIGDETSAPDDLREAAVTLAAYWIDQSRSGATSDVTVGQLSKEIMDAAVPKAIRSRLGKRLRAVGGTWR